MRKIASEKELSELVNSWKISGLRVGFVPTMGALHDGHISLIRLAQKKADKVVCSIFVNPTQFNQQEDFEKYPRTVDSDLELLSEANCDVAFVPELQTIYPEGASSSSIDFGAISNSLEGAHRPGHFDGVATVVNRLFDLVQPDLAFFGEKDFQQLAIIRRLTEDRVDHIEIIGCPIVREESGLAMSSRNVRLSEQGRAQAAAIYSFLTALKTLALSGFSTQELESIASRLFQSRPEMELEYLATVESASFIPASSLSSGVNYRILCAVWLEGVRLIDNIELVP